MSRKRKIFLIAALSLLSLLGAFRFVLAQEGDAENGQRLFGEYCAVCHGSDGQGRVGATLSEWFGGINPQAFVRSTVSDGVGGVMPAFAQAKGGPLTEGQIDDIAAYILSWKERVEPAPTLTPIPVTPIPPVAGVSGDPTAGAQVFARECRVCHGAQGQGGVGATLSGPISAPQPAAFLRQMINNGVSGSPMPAFRGVLSAGDIENVVAFILSWEHRPASPATPVTEEENGFNWLVGVAFVIGLLVVAGWLIVRFSQRKTASSE
jgi:cytochrome c oxidase cbb3-type subunit 3